MFAETIHYDPLTFTSFEREKLKIINEIAENLENFPRLTS